MQFSYDIPPAKEEWSQLLKCKSWIGLEQLKFKSDLVGLEAIYNNRGLGGFKILSAKKI